MPWDNPSTEPSQDIDPRQRTVNAWMAKGGVPRHVAEGIADNVGRESGFDPKATGDSGTSSGLYQAHNERQSSLQAQGHWQDPDVQHQWAIGQVQGGDKIATEHWGEIRNAKSRDEARDLFKKYFERPAEPGSYDNPRVIGKGKWNVDDRAIRTEQGRSDAQVVWRDPHDFLAELPPMDDEKEPAGARQKRELEESLDRGDKIEEIPHVDVQTKGGRAKILDYDGRHRAQRAIEEGVNLIPVSYRGIPKGSEIKEFEPMRGEVRPWDFKAVATVPRETLPFAKDRRTLGQDMAQDRDRQDRVAQYAADRHAQAATAKVYTNEAGLPFTVPGPEGQPPAPQPNQAPPERLPGEIPYVGRLSDQIASVFQGAAQGGRMITGEEPVTRLLPENVVGAAAALGGTPLPPASRFTPGLAQIAPEGRNMMAAAQDARGMPMMQRGPPPLSQITPERAALAQDALQRGIPVTGPQNAATQVARERALANAISHTFGEDATALTADVLAGAQKRIGDGLNRIEQGHSVPFDPEFRSDIIEISNDAKSQLTTPGQIHVVDKHLKDIMVDPVKTEASKKAAQAAPKAPGKPAAKPKEALRSGLSGEQFGNLIHEKGPISKLANNPDPGVALFGDRMETALRDLLQRRLPTDQAAEYQGLRYQYKNLKTAEKAVGSVGEVDPAKLDSAVNRAFPNRKRSKDAELVKLSDIANEFVKPARPESPPSGWVRAAEASLGATVGHMAGGPVGGAVGAALAVGGHMAARNLMRSLTQPRLTEALIQRALASLPPPGARRNAINAMMSRPGANTMTQPGGNAMSLAAQPLRPVPPSGAENPR